MADFNSNFKKILQNLENNIKDKEALEAAKVEIFNLYNFFLDEIIYMDDDTENEDCDIEIKCPYCNETFSAEMNDITAQEIICPECNNTIELDWGEDDECGCSDMGCDCCSHDCHHDEDDDM